MGQDSHTLAVFVGRFQPFHAGHLDVVENASAFADSLLMLVGSAYRARSWKNPFHFRERVGFIEKAVETAGLKLPLACLPLVDTLYNDRAWAANVRTAVRLHLRNAGLSPMATRVVLTGYDKDASSAYLKWFPEWDLQSADVRTHEDVVVSATDFRRALFLDVNDPEPGAAFGHGPHETVSAWLAQNPDVFAKVREEAEFTRDYQKRIKAGEEALGYPITINTADAVVIQSGHVLLVRRGLMPGKGLLALPGGHLSPGETALDAAIRELYEECRLDMPKGALRGRLRNRQVFDHPERSERGWVRTEAFTFELEDRKTLEKVRGGDDATQALWVPIAEITPDEMFEDHFDILQTMVPDLPFAYSSLLMAHATQAP